MVGSAAIKQGRSANRKHTYFFFWPNTKCFGFYELFAPTPTNISWLDHD